MRYYKRRDEQKVFVDEKVNEALAKVEGIAAYVSLSTLGDNSTVFDLQVEYVNNDKAKEGNAILFDAGFTTDLKSIK